MSETLSVRLIESVKYEVCVSLSKSGYGSLEGMLSSVSGLYKVGCVRVKDVLSSEEASSEKEKEKAVSLSRIVMPWCGVRNEKLCLCLRKDLGLYNEYLKDLVFVDYKVRILDGGTEAITRVVIESSDKDIDSWFTVGVSPNIVEASFQALMDSINYKLIKEGAPIKKSD